MKKDQLQRAVDRAQVGERRPETAAPTYLPAAPPAGMRTRRRRHRLISDCALWGGAQPGRLAAGLLLEQLVRLGRVCGGSIRVTAGGAEGDGRDCAQRRDSGDHGQRLSFVRLL